MIIVLMNDLFDGMRRIYCWLNETLILWSFKKSRACPQYFLLLLKYLNGRQTIINTTTYSWWKKNGTSLATMGSSKPSTASRAASMSSLKCRVFSSRNSSGIICRIISMINSPMWKRTCFSVKSRISKSNSWLPSVFSPRCPSQFLNLSRKSTLFTLIREKRWKMQKSLLDLSCSFPTARKK